MAIPGYEAREAFQQKLYSVVYPARPVNSPEHLFGRTRELDRIEKALCAPGRQVFIFGDRGVGKTSLAATAATQYQSADANYIDISGSPQTTLKSIVANIAEKAITSNRLTTTSKNSKISVGTKYLGYESITAQSPKDIYANIRDVGDAVEILRQASAIHSEKPIVVIDEFDRIGSPQERNYFADLLKQLGDKQVPIKFIFTGVAKALEDLLGAHSSAFRQLETIELPKLSWDSRWDIALYAARAFKIEIPRDIYIRIAAISDGYPHYVHLVTEKLLWRIHDETQFIHQATWEHYYGAVNDAIASISAELRKPYEMAITQKSGDYDEVLWSTADGEDLHRYLENMYKSYQTIMRQLPEKQALDYNKYCARIRNLKKASHGKILVSEKRPGLYSYAEKMLRGYVRMQAEAHEIRLVGEEASQTEKQYMHVPAKVRTGYFGSAIPAGVKFKRKHGEDESI